MINSKISQENYYKRQITLNSFGKMGQNQLSHSRVLIVGAGGLGHPVSSYLAGSGVGHIHIIDHDVIDLTNLHRQVFFTIDDLGLKKSEVLASRLQKLNPLIDISYSTHKINAINAREFISTADIVIDCTDNLTTKFLLHDTCYLLEKQFILGAIDHHHGEIKSFQFNTTSFPCLRCLYPHPPVHECISSCAENGILPPIAGIVGTMMSYEVIKSILNDGKLNNGENLLINCLTGQNTKIKWKQNEECPLCKNTDKSVILKNYLEIHDAQNPIEISIKEINSLEHFTIIDLDQRNIELKELTRDKFYLLTCELGLKSLEKCTELRNNKFYNVWSLYAGKNALKDYKK